MTGLVGEVFAGEACWSEGVVAGLAALLGFLDDEPLLARVCLVDSLMSAQALLQRARELQALRPLLEAGRAGAQAQDGLHEWRAETTIEAVAGVLRGRLLDERAPPFTALLEGLVDQVLGDYRVAPGRLEQARRRARAIMAERSRGPAPEPPAAAIPRWLENPSSFRARRCVVWVAEHPRASNHEVAAGIGASEGYTSMLLGRLYERDVLGKRAGRPGKANAWWLTPEGERIAQALKAKGLCA